MRRLHGFAILLALTLAPSVAHSDDDPPCNAWEIEYTLTGRLRLSDTMMGAGDGEHTVGPGRLVLRFDDVGGEPGGNVRVASYEMTTRFTVDARVLGIGTTVFTDTLTRATTDRCGVAGRGYVGADRTIRWFGPWTTLRTDGHLTCSGMCGKFGAPPHGRSEMHMRPHAVRFGPFAFAPNEKTFHMDYTIVDKTRNDTARLALAGREKRRRCTWAPPCG